MTVAARQGAHGVQMFQILALVDEAGQAHLAPCGEVAEQGIGTDLVALVGRVGQAVAEEQDIPGHDPDAVSMLCTDAILAQSKSSRSCSSRP